MHIKLTIEKPKTTRTATKHVATVEADGKKEQIVVAEKRVRRAKREGK